MSEADHESELRIPVDPDARKNSYLECSVHINQEEAVDELFLASTGAQEMLIFVKVCLECFSQSSSIWVREQSDHSEITQRTIRGHSESN